MRHAQRQFHFGRIATRKGGRRLMTPVSSPRSYGTGICLHRRPCSEPAGAASADRLSFGRCRCRPLTPGFVRDAGIAEKLADIGVILLIFCTGRSEEHTSELQSLMRISYAVFCLKKNNTI